jgi:hypothetical protein
MLSSLEIVDQANHEITYLVFLSYIHRLGPNKYTNVAKFHPIDLYIPGLSHQTPWEPLFGFQPKAT